MNDLTYVQERFVNYIEKIMQSNKLSHSYLIELGDFSLEFPLVLLFVKMILCPESVNKVTDLNCNRCNSCRLIDENSFPEMYNSFYSAIEEKRNDFVLVRIENYESDKEFIDKYYKIYKTYTYRYYKNTITSYDFTVYLMVPLE